MNRLRDYCHSRTRLSQLKWMTKLSDRFVKDMRKLQLSRKKSFRIFSKETLRYRKVFLTSPKFNSAWRQVRKISGGKLFFLKSKGHRFVSWKKELEPTLRDLGSGSALIREEVMRIRLMGIFSSWDMHRSMSSKRARFRPCKTRFFTLRKSSKMLSRQLKVKVPSPWDKFVQIMIILFKWKIKRFRA